VPSACPFQSGMSSPGVGSFQPGNPGSLRGACPGARCLVPGLRGPLRVLPNGLMGRQSSGSSLPRVGYTLPIPGLATLGSLARSVPGSCQAGPRPWPRSRAQGKRP
jgi:hypothetical protein